jgi:methionine-S-sulfoxide reductase
VIATVVGYAGGSKPAPTYRSMGDHTECVQVTFDPERITYEELLEEFWALHDGSYPAFSTQYRSVVLAHGDEQARIAEEVRDRLSLSRGRAILTQIEPYAGFTQAEDYHQKYRLRHDRLLHGEMAEYYPAVDGLVRSTAAARLNGFLDGGGSKLLLEREIDSYGLSERAQAHLREIVL